MKPAQKVLIIFIALLVAEVASQKGEEIPQCCCSSKYPHRTLQTAPEYNLRFLVSILPMKYPAKFFFRLMTRLPKESVRPMMAHYKELREMNAALDAKLRLPPLSNYDIADLRYCQEVPPDSNRRLLV